MSQPTEAEVREALAHVEDPELGRPITELGMVKSIGISGGDVTVGIYLTIAGCPMRETLDGNVRAAVSEVPGVASVSVNTDVMNDEQRRALRDKLRGSNPEAGIPFTRPDSVTRVFAVASGKGGVGKSSVTVNLAAGLAARGLRVGLVDADVYGHSIPRLMGSDQPPTMMEDDMILPPISHGVKMISIGHFVEGNAPVVWRGPMLHRTLQQFLTDIFWGDLDVLLMDLPPGTGDVALSVAQLTPNAELIVVTTPQAAAAEVAERAGSIAQQTGQRVAGVVENMSGMVMPDGTVMDVFGAGGGERVAANLGAVLNTEVPLLGTVPLDPALRIHGDTGTPVVLAEPDSPSGRAFAGIVASLAVRRDSLAGRSLGIHPRG